MIWMENARALSKTYKAECLKPTRLAIRKYGLRDQITLLIFVNRIKLRKSAILVDT